MNETELVLFNLSKKRVDHELEIKVNGKKVYQADSVNYVGINIDKNFTWKHHINNVAIKISKAN